MPSATLTHSEPRSVKDISDNLGVLIAFILPGFVALWAISYCSDIVAGWLQSQASASVNGFLFAALASLAAGVFISGVRWAIFDECLNVRVGLARPAIDYGLITRTETGTRALMLSTQEHYRYYQFYANMAVALLCVYGARFLDPKALGPLWKEALGFVLFVAVEASLYFSAHDALRKHDADLVQLNKAARLDHDQRQAREEAPT